MNQPGNLVTFNEWQPQVILNNMVLSSLEIDRKYSELTSLIWSQTTKAGFINRAAILKGFFKKQK